LNEIKTSIYINEELWKKFEKYAILQDKELSKLLKEIIKDELTEELINKIMLEFMKEKNIIDFEPIEIEGEQVIYIDSGAIIKRQFKKYNGNLLYLSTFLTKEKLSFNIRNEFIE
jgi:hypothetical protein